MAQREDAIASSICSCIIHSDRHPSFLTTLPAYFYAYAVTYACVDEHKFTLLRETWKVQRDDYRKSFSGPGALQAMGDMGFSGSTFFRTRDRAFLVKSVPRHFEHSFFRDDLLQPYFDYMRENPASLLVRITDFLECIQHSVGTTLGLAPSHHIVMENIMYGQDEDRRAEEEAGWERYDLKPMSYFYPERDVAHGVLASEATKRKLADEFPDKLVLTLDQAEEFKAQLAKDTQLLAKCNAVDYSLFLVRIPQREAPKAEDQPALQSSETGTKPVPPSQPPFAPPGPPSWRTGVQSVDGRWIYRTAILDFFWAKHKVHAKVMTGLIQSYNLIDKQGPMSITTEAPEYRNRFLKMCSEMIEAKDGDGGSAAGGAP